METTDKSVKIPHNSKGHPSVGHLTVKKLTRQPRINHYLDRCTTLENTAKVFEELNRFENTSNINIIDQDIKSWQKEVYNKLYDFVNRGMNPTFDEIDAMLLVCQSLLYHKKKHEIEEFILNCPKNFIVIYSNNSERTPTVLSNLDALGLYNIRTYLISHIHESKLGTWNERRNAHIKGNLLLECTI